MSNQRANRRPRAKRAEIAAYLEDREDEFLDAIVSTAALVARADGWVQDVERTQLLAFVDQKRIPFAPEDVLAHFEQCVRELREPDGPTAIVQRLSRHGDSPLAAVIVSIGEEVAAADSRLDVREHQLLRVIRATLDGGTP